FRLVTFHFAGANRPGLSLLHLPRSPTMKTKRDFTSTYTHLVLLARFSALVAIAVGFLVLVGWALDTAICFICSGVALGLLAGDGEPSALTKTRKFLSRVLSGLVILGGLASLVEY